LRYLNFVIVIPTSSISKDSLAYPVKVGVEWFLCFVSQWLKLKKNEGFSDDQYNLWILGKTSSVLSQEPC
jgi:hypothetical protein